MSLSKRLDPCRRESKAGLSGYPLDQPSLNERFSRFWTAWRIAICQRLLLDSHAARLKPIVLHAQPFRLASERGVLEPNDLELQLADLRPEPTLAHGDLVRVLDLRFVVHIRHS